MIFRTVEQIYKDDKDLLKTTAMKFYRRVFEPTFDELTLFVLAYTCVLLIGVGTYSLISSGQIHQHANGLAALIPATIIAAGIALSLYHAFSTRKKMRLEKQIMFLFASFICGFAGIWGGTYVLSKSDGWSWIMVFPMLNMVSSYILLANRDRVLDESCIDDRNATAAEVAVSAAIVTVVYLVTMKYMHFHWAAILSICVAYGTNLNPVIIHVLQCRRCSRDEG